jgi:hypothetical protein
MKKKSKNEEETKTDLKHDSMEYIASAEDGIINEDDDISAEELDAIEDDPANEAYALNAEETDRQIDEDNLPDEDWIDDIEKEDEETNDEYHRK